MLTLMKNGAAINGPIEVYTILYIVSLAQVGSIVELHRVILIWMKEKRSEVIFP